MASSSSEPLAAAVREFQAVLTPAQNTQLLAHSSKPDATSILTFTAEVDRLNARQRSRCVSSRLFGILQSVQDFSAIADTFVSSHPDIAALVWGTVKFTILVCFLSLAVNFSNPLKAINNITSFFDKLSECFLRLRNSCPRYSEYQLLFGDSIRLQKALCTFYATIVRFCTRAIQIIEAPRLTLAKALWRPFEREFGAFEDELRRQNEEVREETKLASEQAAAREREAAVKHRTSGSLFRTEVKQIGKEAQERRLRRDQQKAKAERETLLEKLSLHDNIGALKRIRKKRHGTTSSWLTESKAFKEWIEDTKSSILWLTGILGSGKSVVAAAVINDLLCRPRGGIDHTAFFFCEYDNASSLIARTILGTLIRQCLTADTLPNTIEDRLKELFKGTSPDAEDLEPLLLDIATTSRTMIFVIDGFDECARADRITVLKMLHRLMSSSQPMIKIFLSSREDVIGDIGRVFTTCWQVSMDCEEARADVLTYVNDIIAEKIEEGELVVGDIQLIQDIRTVLVRGAKGMFLWVAFQIEDLCRQKCDADIRSCLTTLPKDLTETYERVLSRIVNEGNSEIVDRIFRWVAAAKRPLQLEELREAIAIKPGDPFLQRDRLVNDAERLIPWCGSLVISDEEDLLVQFAHHTVKEFLLSEHYNVVTRRFHFQLYEADHMAGEICVTYLNFNDFKRQVVQLPRARQAIQPGDLIANTIDLERNNLAKYGLKFARMVTKRSRAKFDVMQHLDYRSGRDSVGSLERLEMQYSFLAYASEFWLPHTAGFTQKSTHIWALWKQLLSTEHPLAVKPWTIDDEGNTEKSITEYILNESHCALVSCLYSTRIPGAPPIDVRHLLFEAVGKGNSRIVKVILGLGDSAVPYVDEGLREAAGGGHLEVVEKLLAVKADVNAVGGNWLTALHRAAGRGHLEVVERLLAAGANVNAAGFDGHTALHEAAGGGHLDVVERLLAAGSNANAALHEAAGGGHFDVVERLLAAGTNVNAEGGNGLTALHRAAGRGHLEVVKRLLAAGANVNAAGFDGHTALHEAAGGGHLDVVERLLAAGAYFNVAGGNGLSVLQAARAHGQTTVVQRLLETGAI